MAFLGSQLVDGLTGLIEDLNGYLELKWSVGTHATEDDELGCSCWLVGSEEEIDCCSVEGKERGNVLWRLNDLRSKYFGQMRIASFASLIACW